MGMLIVGEVMGKRALVAKHAILTLLTHVMHMHAYAYVLTHHQLSQLQSSGSLGPGPVGKLMNGRGMRRGDDVTSGGRLSRRNADPVAEAERKAQQEKLYSLDLERVLAGE